MTRSTDRRMMYAPGSPPANGNRSVGVVAIDAVPIYRDGLSALVTRTPGLHWAGHAATHHAAMQLREQAHPDVVLLDSGIDPNCHLTRLLHSGDTTLTIVALVRDAARNPAYLAGVLAAGARAVVPRNAESRRVIEAMRRAHLERRYVDPALAPLATRPKRRPSADGDQPPRVAGTAMPLSRREYQVLQLVAEGLENSAIAKMLFLSVETVRTHVKSILRKLSARDRTHAVTTAFRYGLLIPESCTDGADLAPLPQRK